MKKKHFFMTIFSAIIIIGCLLGLKETPVNAATYTAGGTCGNKLEWYLTTDGVLTIEGTGTMNYWTWGKYPSWYDYNDQITSVIIKKGVTEVGGFAFYDCNSGGYKNLVSVTLPDTITEIGAYAFAGNKDLKTINVPKNLTTIGGYAFCGCSSLTEYTISSSVTSIGDKAFCETGLTNVTIPATVKSMEAYAFENCDSLKSAKIGVGTGSFTIEYQAFYGCDNLETVVIGDAVTYIGVDAFQGCVNLKNLTIGRSVETIDGDAFSNCTSLEEVVIPDNVKVLDRESWGHGPFQDCTSLKKVTFGTGVETITANAFSGSTAITEIYFCGDAPTFEGTETFSGVVATAYYPSGNTSWRPTVMTNHGGQIDWQVWNVPVSHYTPTITSINNTAGNITLNWSAVKNAVGYYVYRKVGSAVGAEWVKVADTTSRTYSDTSVTNGTKYQYKIVAYDKTTVSNQSSSKTMYRLTQTNISKLSNQKGKKMTVKWKKNTKASGYQIKYSTKSSFKSSKTKTAAKKLSSKQLKNLKKNKTYFVKIRSYKKVSGKKYYSAWSDVKKIKIRK